MEPIETIILNELNNMKIKIVFDDDPQSPREFENVCKIVYWHPKYKLGDKYISSSMSKEEMFEFLGEEPLAILPVYIYDHSGVTISTNSFSCQWDSGQVGWAYVTKENAKYIGITDLSSNNLENIIKEEIKYYDQYLRGEIFGWILEDNSGDVLDSCYGFYDKEDAIEQARHAASDYFKQ